MDAWGGGVDITVDSLLPGLPLIMPLLLSYLRLLQRDILNARTPGVLLYSAFLPFSLSLSWPSDVWNVPRDALFDNNALSTPGIYLL